MLLGTHDAQSPLRQLRSQHRLLELIIRDWVLVTPEVLFLEVLIAEMLEVNPGVTEARLRKGLELNPDGSIKGWDLNWCGLRALPELFGAVRTTEYLLLNFNELTSLPDSFGSITVGGDLRLYYNDLSSLPDSFGSITVGRDLELNDNQLKDQDIPAAFPNVSNVQEFQIW